MSARVRWIAVVAVIAVAGLVTIFLVVSRSPVGQWFDRDGNPISEGRPRLLTVEAGSDHCGWKDTYFMWLAWPLDRAGNGAGERTTRLYIWQTDDAYPQESLAAVPGMASAMPSDATYTGLHRGPWELWVSESTLDQGVFVADGDTIQQWAFASEPVFCA